MEAVNILSLENTVAPFTTIRNFEEKNELIFTRYLFSKVEVKISLFTSLLEHEFREALYWAYELFYSGFRDETMDFVMSIYNENYKNINDFDFDLFLNDNYNEWYNDKSKEWILGVIVWNIAIREYDINPFISKLHGYKMAHYENIINKQKKHIRITMLDISTYKTIDHIKDKAWCTVLKNAYKFKCRKEYNGLFSVSPNDITKQYRYDWLYYASKSPIWEERVLSYGGIMNPVKKCIDFYDAGKEEEFYSLYNYEPDEQSMKIQEHSIGNSGELQMNIRYFSKKYGAFWSR